MRALFESLDSRVCLSASGGDLPPLPAPSLPSDINQPLTVSTVKSAGSEGSTTPTHDQPQPNQTSRAPGIRVSRVIEAPDL